MDEDSRNTQKIAMSAVLTPPAGFGQRLLAQATANTFTCVMGTAGLGLLWRTAAQVLNLPAAPGEWILAFSAVVFVVLLGAHLLRALRLHAQWRHEWADHLGASFMGAITISGHLMATAALPYDHRLAEIIWIPSALAQIALLLYVLGRWIKSHTEPAQVLPVWLIPMVGSAAVSFAGVSLGHAEICWLMWSAALICWLGFLPLLLYRLIAVQPELPAPAAPTLAILVSAPGVLAVGWRMLTGQADHAFVLLTFSSLFFALLVLRLLGWVVRAPFSRAWWAFTFPGTALATALLRYHEATHSGVSAALAWGGLGGASAILALIWLLALRSGLSATTQVRQRR